MDCDTVKEKLPFLDDGLDSETVKAVKAHLRSCDSCRREYQEQKAMMRRFREAFAGTERECSQDFLAAVHTKIRKRSESRAVYRLAFSAAAIIVFAVGITIYAMLPGGLNNTGTEGFVLDDSLFDFETYVAERYLTTDELNTLVTAEEDSTENTDLFRAYVAQNYVDVSVEDMMEILSDDDIEYMLASY